MTEETTEAIEPSETPSGTEAVEATAEDSTVSPSSEVPEPSAPEGQATIAETATDETEAESVVADEWRQRLAGKDEAFLKKLGRFHSLENFGKSYRDLERKLSEVSGKVAPTLPENPTDEDLAAYRKASGIPETPEGYIEALPDGLVIGDEDKEQVDTFLKAMHDGNAKPDDVHRALSWWAESKEAAATAQVERDREYRAKAEQDLKFRLGNEYGANLNAMRAFLSTAPADENGTPLGDLLMGARLADGTALGDNPTALMWLMDMAVKANPVATIAPGDSATSIDTIESQMRDIESKMGTPLYNDAEAKRWEELNTRLNKIKAA